MSKKKSAIEIGHELIKYGLKDNKTKKATRMEWDCFYDEIPKEYHNKVREAIGDTT